jgi:3-isopropylmalate/(R)-2-methylmalate dehydratase large subunit
MIAPDQKNFDFLEGRLYAPKGEAWTKAVAYWKTLKPIWTLFFLK